MALIDEVVAPRQNNQLCLDFWLQNPPPKDEIDPVYIEKISRVRPINEVKLVRGLELHVLASRNKCFYTVTWYIIPPESTLWSRDGGIWIIDGEWSNGWYETGDLDGYVPSA